MELPVKAPVPDRRKISYRLETKNLTYRLCRSFILDDFCGLFKEREEKIVLRSVSCEARPGEITAIAGPSGAGKTTLLEILAGKVSPGGVSGQVLVNGCPVDSPGFRRVSGFVPQEDALFPLLTVQETLTYNALFRLKARRKEAGTRVNRLIQELGLEQVKDSRIGDGSRSGISGGERRRVSIGVELVHDPDIILIDEPTSGLDSASALHVVMLLKDMAVKQGKTIVLTIHQPGFRILEQINRVVLLSNGSVVHNGSVSLLYHRIKFTGHLIPRRVNVLEYAIDIAESLEPVETRNCREVLRCDAVREKWKSCCNNADTEQSVSGNNNLILEEVLILGQRSCKNIFRTKQLFATRALQASIAGLILGTIYLNVGNKNRERKVSLQTRTGFFAFTLTFLLSSTTEGLPIFLQDRRILMRETSRRAYSVLSYVLADTLIFIPFLLIISCLFSTPVYWLVGLRREVDGFLYFWLVMWMVLLMSNSFVACFSALVPNFIMGTSVISGLMGSFFMFSGYFIAKDKIPSYWQFMHYLSLFKYPFECLMINEYRGDLFLMRQQDLTESRKWSNLGVMFSFIVSYRVLGFFILWYRCYRTRT
ncbi:PREDICTED: ABC transporter G family member 10 [Tarenaya hassleriana]|uniref:ABC transporter G family member 10 n=1 Tax=Tarenaya hassleriana TaxID=28532 RepID=UPI00053C5343|nr:PREDICTED: ABC transporter G family member 10 [Tarenaya hassleriana]